MNLMKDATDSWPEDEGALAYKQWLGLIEDESLEYANQWLEKQAARMYDVFDGDNTLCARFMAEFKRLCKY